ncbi:unnamed protein product, partial [Ectocarpus sp. 12 AP-2014]
RANPVPRCLHRRLELSLCGRGEALVYIYTGAAADVVGNLQGVPICLDLARPCI